MPDELEPEPEPSFEQALSQLERIVASLERGEPELTSALAKYQKGVSLLAQCHGLLERAEQSVALLTGVDEQGNPLTVPFDAAATFSRDAVSATSSDSPETPTIPAAKRTAPGRPSKPKTTRPLPDDPMSAADPPF